MPGFLGESSLNTTRNINLTTIPTARQLFARETAMGRDGLQLTVATTRPGAKQQVARRSMTDGVSRVSTINYPFIFFTIYSSYLSPDLATNPSTHLPCILGRGLATAGSVPPGA